MASPALPPGIRHIAFARIDSTNAEALRLAAAGEAGPVWITAELQEAGRGRQGRSWVSEPGNLYATLLTRLDAAPADAGQVSFVTALAVAEAVAAAAPGLAGEISLKWPNDLLLGGRKLAGILIEAVPGGLAAIGCGINLRHRPDASETRFPPAALAEFGVMITPEEMLGHLAAALARRMAQWAGGPGFAAIRDGWLKRAHGLGAEVAMEAAGAPLAGVFEGVAADGALLLRLVDGSLRHLHAGDVRYVRYVNGTTP